MLSKYLWQNKEEDRKKLAYRATVKPQADDTNNFDSSRPMKKGGGQHLYYKTTIFY